MVGNDDQSAAETAPELIDPVNLKAYDVVVGETLGETELLPGSPRTIVYYYAAPQDRVEAIDLRFSSQIPPLTGVPFEP